MTERVKIVMVAIATLLFATNDAKADPLACQRAIAKSSTLFTRATTKALGKCELAKRAGKIPPAVECASDGPTTVSIARAEEKLRAAIAKACGGKNAVCDAGDAGADADDALGAIGWDIGACPGLGDDECTGPIDDCDDIAACLACVGRAGAIRSNANATASFVAAEPRTPVNRCQTAIGQATATYFSTRAKALQQCQDRVLRGITLGPCPAEGATVLALAKAEAKKVATICKACGGADKECGGADDLTPVAIGFAASCLTVTPPGAASCGGPIASLADAVACVDCVADYATGCLDAAAVPGLVDYPAACAPAPTPTATPIPTVTLTPTPTATSTPPAGAAAIGCERVIVKESAKHVQTRARALAGCEALVLAGKLPLGTDCALEPKTTARIAKATARLASRVAKACGGTNRICDGDHGADGEPTLGEIGWSLTTCPGIVGGDCGEALGTCNEVGSCLACLGGAAVGSVTELAYGVVPATSGSVEAKCQSAIGKAATDFVAARSTALQKCADNTIRGRTSGPCPDPGDGKTAAALAKAMQRFVGAVCKACGGDDRSCGGGDDLGPAALGFGAACPDVQLAGGAGCARSLQTLDDLIACIACTAEFATTCLDRAAIPDLAGYPSACAGSVGTPTPTPTATPGGGGAICGNTIVEAGEACDDGNTVSCDACPADCKTAPVACPATAIRHPQRVRLRAPDGALLQGAIACLQYPKGVVGLPGTGNVTGRVSGVSGLATLNDFNDAVQVSFVINPAIAELTPTISFDLCTGASAPMPTDFVCEMRSASNQGTPIEPPSLVDCTPVAAP